MKRKALLSMLLASSLALAGCGAAGTAEQQTNRNTYEESSHRDTEADQDEQKKEDEQENRGECAGCRNSREQSGCRRQGPGDHHDLHGRL